MSGGGSKGGTDARRNAGSASTAVGAPGTQAPSPTAFIDHLRQQQFTPTHPAHGGRAGSSPGGVFSFGGSSFQGGSFQPGSSPVAGAGLFAGTPPGVESGFGGMIGPCSPTSPSHATSVLMQSFNNPLHDLSFAER